MRRTPPLPARSAATLLCAAALGAASPARAAEKAQPPTMASPPPPASHAPNSRDNVLRLAQLLNDERTVAGLKGARALQASCTEDELLDAVRAYEKLGDPEAAVRVLRQRSARFPEELAARVQLAYLYERMGKPDEAVSVWEASDKADRKSRLTTAMAVAYARSLARLWRLGDAFAVLKAHRPAQGEAAEAYWHDLAAMAWELEDTETALEAYRFVWAADRRAPNAAIRLMTLAAEAGEQEEAIAVALDGYAAEKNLRYVLFIADAYAKSGNWGAAKRALDLPESKPALVASREDYWLLRADVSTHLGDADGARDAFRAALRANPSSTTTRVALLWDAVDRRDTASVRGYVEAWRSDAPGEPALWGPYAVGLVQLGRAREAVPFFEKRVRASPDDYVIMLEYADTLDQLHQGEIALRLRRHAWKNMRSGLRAQLRTPTPGPADLHLLEQHARISRRLAGAEEGERWFTHAMGASGASPERDDFAIGWYLESDRLEFARRRIATSPWGPSREPPSWASYRLTLASTDDDRAEMGRLLARSRVLGFSERYKAELELERDGAAMDTLRRELARPDSPDEVEAHAAARELIEHHAPGARIGATYAYVDGLDTAGPDVAAGHDLGRARVTYNGFARQMTSPNESLTLSAPVIEADVGALLRFQRPDTSFEIGGGVNYQPDRPVPRLELHDVRSLLHGRLTTSIDMRVNTFTEDTPFLRLAGVRDELEIGGHLELTPHFYTTAEIVGREDTSRVFRHLGAEVGGSVDLGAHLHRRAPELNVAFRSAVHHRDNVSVIPDGLQGIIPPGSAADIERFMPPSYRMFSLVVQAFHGSFFERQRASRLAFPKYDCEALLGYLSPNNALTGQFRCAASARVSSRGRLSFVGSYMLGVVGIEDATNARATVMYTQLLP